jgi:CheY-like chemotaxis protein
MKGHKILVIEDSPLNQKLVKLMLSKEPYELAFAESAEEGLKLGRLEVPDLILMDIRLPGMDGLEATRQVRKDRLLRDCLVVAYSAGAMRGDREKAMAAGCDGFISKPVKPQVFLEKIAAYLATQNDGINKVAIPSAPRVLLVTDSPDTLGALIAQLSGGLATLKTSPIGPGALVKARAWLPEVVIIESQDAHSAIGLLKELKESKELARIQYLAVSNEFAGDNRARFLLAGADSLLEKPASVQEFKNRLDLLLNTRQQVRQHRLRLEAAEVCGIRSARSKGLHQIVVVEKEPIAARILEFGLPGLRTKILVATTVTAARRYILEGGIDLVTLDTSVPDCDGLRLVEQLAIDGASVSAPVMVVSAVADAGTRVRAFEQGAAEFLVSPVNDVEMRILARRLLIDKTLTEELRYLGKDISMRHEEEGAARSKRVCFFHSLLEFCLQSAIANRHPLAVALIRSSGGAPAPAEWAAQLRRYCREFDWFGRLADGSFAAIFAHMGGEAAELLGRFKKGIEANLSESVVAGGEPQFGLAVYPQDGTHGSQLLEKARAQLEVAVTDR